MQEKSKILDLFYFNLKEIKPIIFIIVRISNENEEKLVEENVNFIYESLLNNNYVEESDVLVVNLIKEHQGKIINWILPTEKSNQEFLKNIENNKEILNSIILTTMKKANCHTLISLSTEELKIKDCDIDLGMFAEIYF